MALILDTYNLLHAGSAMGGAMADLTVRKLCQWIVQSPTRQKTTLVIDGRPKPEEPSENEFPDLHLVYSGAGIEADKVIGQMVERSHNRRHLIVVTNDRAVAAQARQRGAVPQSCEAFLSSLITAHSIGRKLGQRQLPAHKTGGIVDKAQTEHWLREFGVGNASEVDQPAKPKSKDNPDDLDMKKLMGF